MNHFHWIPKIELVCIYCGQTFIPRRPYLTVTAKYCTTECRGRARRGKNSNLWKGGLEASRERERNNPKHRLNALISKAINKSLRKGQKGGRKWQDLVGYTTKQLEKRLHSTIPLGYTWQNFMEGKLHIDHKIPINAFNFSKPEHIDFERCWMLENLQLLPAKENAGKHAKLYELFQPSLAL